MAPRNRRRGLRLMIVFCSLALLLQWSSRPSGHHPSPPPSIGRADVDIVEEWKRTIAGRGSGVMGCARLSDWTCPSAPAVLFQSHKDHIEEMIGRWGSIGRRFGKAGMDQPTPYGVRLCITGGRMECRALGTSQAESTSVGCDFYQFQKVFWPSIMRVLRWRRKEQKIGDFCIVVSGADEPRTASDCFEGPGANRERCEELRNSTLGSLHGWPPQYTRCGTGLFDPSYRGPILSVATQGDCYLDLLYPHRGILEAFSTPPQDYPSRPNRLVWRGGNTGHSAGPRPFVNHRLRLMEFELAHKQELGGRTDFQIIAWPDPATSFWDRVRLSGLIGALEWIDYRISFPDMVNLGRLHLDVDGNSYSVRLPRLARSRAAVLKAGVFDDYFSLLLEEGVHYRRISLSYSDLPEKLQGWTEKQGEAEQAQECLYELSRVVLNQEYTDCYVHHLLLRLSQAFGPTT